MDTLKGHFIVPTAKNSDRGLYFIFHHESDGVLAFDLTQPHPDIPFRIFEALIDGHDLRNKENSVLLGGPEQSDTAMLVLHNGPQGGDDSHIINDDFAFLSYKFILLPGKPPMITKSNDAPGRLSLNQGADFLITMGFRLWTMDALEEELRDWQWNFLPAASDIVFSTPAEDRLRRALQQIN